MKSLFVLASAFFIAAEVNAQQLTTETPLVDKAFTLATKTLYKNAPDSLLKPEGNMAVSGHVMFPSMLGMLPVYLYRRKPLILSGVLQSMTGS